MQIGASPQPSLDAQLAALRLPPSANGAEVKRAFRALVRAYHPDTSGGGAAGRSTHERLTEIVAAYRGLTRNGLVADGADDGGRRNGQLVDIRV